jgi:hypothetical protein
MLLSIASLSAQTIDIKGTVTDVKMVPDSTEMDFLPAVGLPYVDLADKSGPCPRCGSEKVLPILYGITTPKGQEAIRNGEYVAGGCMVGRANYACASCEQRFYVREAPLKIENTSADSLMVIVDGIIHVAPVESDLVLQPFTFISDKDIESIDLIGKDSPGNAIFCRPMKMDMLFITTRKESEIHNFYLNGQAVHKKKGIRLGYLFDEALLKQQIQKNWKINPDKITSLSVNGREIRIKTK